MVVVGLMAVGLAVGGVRLDATFDLDAFVPDLSAQSPLPDQGRNIDSRPGEDDPLGEFSFWAVVMIGSVLAAPVIVMLIRMLARPDDRPPPPRPAQEKPVAAAADGGEVRAALRAALADLDAGDDPRRAVIACWLRLEHVAAGSGTPRMAADTTADLVARLLAVHKVGEPALDRLAGAYRQARYAPHEVAESLRDTARRALAEVDAELSS
ncbi:protein of unknown function [Streptosporangium subroseum]|uniref:Protein-glutamine gamma-glutamyltransferase-like C-terminal domain-containing protein n=1 Tax=Streptosporangium subroseum TaxID=106412 RepID=A0A239B3A4_9ACTN|nr:DUF4129 domain-containing protein [Streptosporangium subroseum]SNS02071.1 protein of unknown function [Streptosporangium subroseum]